MSKPPLHRKEKQDDAETLAVALQTCCAYSNSALVEDGVCCGSNEFYYRVAEHYCEVDEAKPEDLENVAKILETLAEQFRTFAENARQEEGTTSSIWSSKDEDDDDERMEARELESRTPISYDVKTGKPIYKE